MTSPNKLDNTTRATEQTATRRSGILERLTQLWSSGDRRVSTVEYMLLVAGAIAIAIAILVAIA